MELRTILVNLDVDFYSSTLLHAAVDLAQRFGARISAVAAASPAADLIAVQGATVSTQLFESERAGIEARLGGLQSEFLEVVPAALRGECTIHLDAPNRILARQARGADLVLVGAHVGGEEVYARNVDVGGLLLAAGRPVLRIAPTSASVKAEGILVAWKDCREARRAVADALPLLKQAQQVVVAGIEDGDSLVEKAVIEDVVAWLQRHDVEAQGNVYPAHGSAAETLQKLARDGGADLIVAGAFGHSRLRELVFGGVTRDLLRASDVNLLMSN